MEELALRAPCLPPTAGSRVASQGTCSRRPLEQLRRGRRPLHVWRGAVGAEECMVIVCWLKKGRAQTLATTSTAPPIEGHRLRAKLLGRDVQHLAFEGNSSKHCQELCGLRPPRFGAWLVLTISAIVIAA